MSHRYLAFESLPPEPGRRTFITLVRSRSSGEVLAQIRWFGRWRQYAFYPSPDTIWNPDCLDAVNARIRDLMASWREERNRREPAR